MNKPPSLEMHHLWPDEDKLESQKQEADSTGARERFREKINQMAANGLAVEGHYPGVIVGLEKRDWTEAELNAEVARIRRELKERAKFLIKVRYRENCN